MTHRHEPQTPETATSGRLSALRVERGARVADTRDRPSDAHTACHRAAILDVMLLGLPDARFCGAAGTRRIHEWADWLAEQAATVTAAELRQLRAERDLLARTLAVHTRQTAADVLAETREALNEQENHQW